MPATEKKLECKICGTARSKSGRPFDAGSLARHMTVFHRDDNENADANGEAPAKEPLACDICGATESGRGRKFFTNANVLQHKRKSHPEDDGRPPAANGVRKPAPPSSNGRMRPQPSTATYPPGRGVSQVKFCPCCGFNLTVINAAMQFVNAE